MEIKTTNTKTLVKTLDILRSFDDLHTHQKASEIAKRLDLNISTVSRHLSDLMNYGFLEQDSESANYYLGPAIINLAGVALNSNNMYKISHYEVQRLSEKLGMHAGMSILRGNNIVYLFEICTAHSYELLMPIGYERPALTSAMGRVMLADLPIQTVQNMLAKVKINRLTPYTLMDTEEIMNKIKEARELSYTILIDEIKVGTSSIAAAVRNKNGKVIGALALSGETSKFVGAQRKEMVDNVLITANNISAKLGYFPR